jgi:hypothetical protein
MGGDGPSGRGICGMRSKEEKKEVLRRAPFDFLERERKGEIEVGGGGVVAGKSERQE